MANQLHHLPHTQCMESGYNKYDPVHNAIFEVYFALPEAVRKVLGQWEAVLTEQVTEVSGLAALQKIPAAGSQKFHGVDVSFLNPTLDNTYAEITITLNLNLANHNDNFVLRAFKEWGRLSYDLQTGMRSLKPQYMSDNITIAEANRDGTIWRAYAFKDTLITNIQGLDTLNYTSNDPQTLQVTFRSDYWTEVLGSGNGAVNPDGAAEGNYGTGRISPEPLLSEIPEPMEHIKSAPQAH